MQRFGWIVAIAAILTSVVPVSVGYSADVAKVCVSDRLSHWLSEGGVQRLVQGIAIEKPDSPEIVSRWFVGKGRGGRCADSDRKFGFHVLEAMAGSRRRALSEDLSALRSSSTALFDLADWIAQREGYGNHQLELALRVAGAQVVGRYIIDAEDPDLDWARRALERVEAILGRAGARSTILNREAQLAIFPDDFTDHDLRRAWDAMRAKLAAQRRRSRGTQVDPLPTDHSQRRLLDRMGVDPEKADPLDQFFADDICEERTEIGCWSLKQHSRIAFGEGPTKTPLASLLEYRQIVGGFPDRSWLAKGSSAGIRRFKELWAQKVGVGVRRSVPTEAWGAYMGLELGSLENGERDTVSQGEDAK